MKPLFIPSTANVGTLAVSGLDKLSNIAGLLSPRALNFAQTRAVNRMAFGVRAEWASTAGSVFDRPTTITRNAFLVRPASRSKPEAVVFIRDEVGKGTPPSIYLQAQIGGGARALKRFETLLVAAGAMLPGDQAVPAQGARLNAQGNIPASVYNRILSALRAQGDSLQNQTARSAARKKRRGDAPIFAVPRKTGGLRPGIYQRTGRGVKIIIAFVRTGTYKPILRTKEIGERVFSRDAGRIMGEEIEQELDRAARLLATTA